MLLHLPKRGASAEALPSPSGGTQVNTRRTTGGGLVGKILVSIAIVMAAAGVVGVGTFAVFTNTASVSQSTSSGTITLNPINTSGANNRLSIGATNIAAGDTIQRAVDLRNTGNLALAGITLTTSASPSSLLDTDVSNGLQMVIDKCSVAWTESGGPPYTYTCGGTTSSVFASAPVIGTNLALSNLTLTAGTDNFLRVTLTLPSGAGNTLQTKSSTITYAFTATQRAGAAQ
jgi:spore coat-associated protein N